MGADVEWMVTVDGLTVVAIARELITGDYILTVHVPHGRGFTQWGNPYASLRDARGGAKAFLRQLIAAEAYDPSRSS